MFSQTLTSSHQTKQVNSELVSMSKPSPNKRFHVFKQNPRQHVYACGKGFFMNYLNYKQQNRNSVTSTQEKDCLYEFTRIEFMDYLLDDMDDQIIKFEMKHDSVLILTQFGKVYGVGRNRGYVLGLRDCNPKPVPVDPN
nr:unnamed protein product [Naegleria fowleri]